MKNYISLLTIFAVLTGSIFALDSSADKIRAGFDEFIGDLAETAPDNAVLSGTWSDGYIGKLIPSMPPHFGVGASLGATKADTTGVNKALKELGISSVSLPGKDNEFVFPAMGVEARIGGLFIPFDLGVKFAILDLSNLFGAEISYKYNMVGGDIRFPILQQDVIKPNLSIGFGYTYLSGGFGFSGSDVNAS
ncbi:MAG: hypothetical protein LBR47_02590, partial [Spirochaetaceae bacterium]|nr:hypothetical protein [Spirochaetaceae bacterium]